MKVEHIKRNLNESVLSEMKYKKTLREAEEEEDSEDAYNKYLATFEMDEDDAVKAGVSFIEDGEEYTWVQKEGYEVQIDFDTWGIWKAESNDGDNTWWVVELDTGFIDWGPCYSLQEAREFLESKEDDYEDDEEDFSDVEFDDDFIDDRIDSFNEGLYVHTDKPHTEVEIDSLQSAIDNYTHPNAEVTPNSDWEVENYGNVGAVINYKGKLFATHNMFGWTIHIPVTKDVADKFSEIVDGTIGYADISDDFNTI